MRADKSGRRAARTGFDWTSAAEVLAKVREETAEVEEALAEQDKDAVREEIGDLLFAVSNLARYVEVDSEDALRRANAKFARRFRSMEVAAAQRGHSLRDLGATELDELWRSAKDEERGEGGADQP
jgi:ATP diphosphatase